MLVTACKCANGIISVSSAGGSCNCNSGVSINPLTDPRNCRRHQAPAGYHYAYSEAAKRCVLINNVTGAVVDQTLGIVQVDPLTLTPANAINKLTAFIKANPLLSVALGFGGYYLLTKKK